MFFIIFLLFVLIPVIELSVLIRVGEVLGTWTTIGLVLFTAVLGVSLVRSQGLNTLMQVQQKLARGEAPGQEIVEGMMLAMAGILLVIPGFVTDAIGLLFLTPLTRRPIAALLFKRMQLRVVAGLQGTMHGGFQAGQGPFGPKPQDPFGQAPFDDSVKKDGNVFEGDFEHKVDPSDIKAASHQLSDKAQDKEQDKDPKP